MSKRKSPRSPQCFASSRCETAVAVSPFSPMYGTGSADPPFVLRHDSDELVALVAD